KFMYIFTSLYMMLDCSCIIDICSLSLHDALPILRMSSRLPSGRRQPMHVRTGRGRGGRSCRGGADTAAVLRCFRFIEEPRPRCRDRKSTRLNSSHVKISYAVFCLKKKIK